MLERRRRESERRRGGGGDGERRHGSEGARVWTGGGGGAVRGSGDAQSRWRKRTVGIGGLKWKTRGRGRAGEADAREAGNHASSYFFFAFILFRGRDTYISTVHAWLCWACCVCLAGVHGWAAGATMPLGVASSPCTLAVTCDLRRPRTTSQASTTPSTSKVPLRSILSPATNGDHGNRDPAGL